MKSNLKEKSSKKYLNYAYLLKKKKIWYHEIPPHDLQWPLQNLRAISNNLWVSHSDGVLLSYNRNPSNSFNYSAVCLNKICEGNRWKYWEHVGSCRGHTKITYRCVWTFFDYWLLLLITKTVTIIQQTIRNLKV
jgi:hypothetical protein